MDSVLKSDIFFFITSIAVIAVGVAAVFAFIYVIRILRDVKKISSVVRDESEQLSHDLALARARIQAEGFRAVVSALRSFFRKGRKGRKNHLKEE